MPSALSALPGVSPLTASIRPISSPSAGKPDQGFGSLLQTAIQSVDTQQQTATQSIQQFLEGKGELHNVALAAQRAEMAFDLGMQIRNKVVSAYQEIMKLQL